MVFVAADQGSPREHVFVWIKEWFLKYVLKAVSKSATVSGHFAANKYLI